jgi:formate dehydrogenase subunit gamma
MNTHETGQPIPNAERQFVRFNRIERAEHLLMLISFTALVVTGLPQKLNTAGASEVIVLALGGIDAVRIIHRVFAAVFVAESAFHVLYLASLFFAGRAPFSMIPTFKDARDLYGRMVYFVGRRPAPPAADRFDYREKFEYWGIVWGAALMIVTGLILVFPAQAALFFPGELVPAARDAHGGEALLAMLVIIIWHLYNAHLSPHVFPIDTSIFTGKISETRMREEHPLELERVLEKEEQKVSAPAVAGASEEA